jgi:hypothetical protein
MADPAQTHVLYLDDSGQKEYLADGASYDHGLSRYFVLGGFFTRLREAGLLAERLASVKRKTFGDRPVEVKSNWLRRPVERKARYLDPFNLTEEQFRSFVDEFYEVTLRADSALLACVVDKEHMTQDYGDARWYTPAAAYEAVVQRAQNELGPPGFRFSVVIDDMTGKTPNASTYSSNLTRHHEQLKKTGCNFFPLRMTALTGRLKFVNSRDSNLIQVADLVAYNVFRQFRDYGEEWETSGLGELPTYDWFRRIAPKFRRGPNGRIQGYGVVKFPLRNRVPWTRSGRPKD